MLTDKLDGPYINRGDGGWETIIHAADQPRTMATADQLKRELSTINLKHSLYGRSSWIRGEPHPLQNRSGEDGQAPTWPLAYSFSKKRKHPRDHFVPRGQGMTGRWLEPASYPLSRLQSPLNLPPTRIFDLVMFRAAARRWARSNRFRAHENRPLAVQEYRALCPHVYSPRQRSNAFRSQ